ncbi:uncharacterized protein LOC144159653 [Haemaphysalis longicornis]
MKEPRRAHSRRCRSVECRSEHAGDEHVFRNPLSKWYRGRRRSKDDEAQLLDAEYDAGNENNSQQHVRDKAAKNSGTTRARPPGPTDRAPTPSKTAAGGSKPRTCHPDEDLSTRVKAGVLHQTGAERSKVLAVPAPPLPARPSSCQPPPAKELCPAERARLAFPGCHSQQPSSKRPHAREEERPLPAQSPPRPTGMQSLDALLGQLCSSRDCNVSMKIKNKDRRARGQDEGVSAREGACTPCSRSHFPANFPTSIEVLMTVNHSCNTHRSISDGTVQRDSSMVSVVHSKPCNQDIISIPKSRFIVVAALLSFVVVACFCITIYSFSVPAEHSHSYGNPSTTPSSPGQKTSSVTSTNGTTSAATVSNRTSGPQGTVNVQSLAVPKRQWIVSASSGNHPRIVIL